MKIQENPMKTFLLLATILTATTVYAAKLYTINMTGKNFASTTFNLMDDGLSDVSGFAIKLDGEPTKDFSVTAEASNEETGNCTLTQLNSSTASSSIFQLEENLDVDSGDTCDFTIVYKSGKKATLSIYKEGT
jgi:hypothetical protein